MRERVDWLVSRSPADGARIVARAWVDPEFKQRLLADTHAGRRLGLDAAVKLVAAVGARRRARLMVCTLCSCYRRRSWGRRRTGTKASPMRPRAVSDPRGTFAGFGIEVGDEVELRMLDSTADVRYLVIPRRPPASGG